MSVFNIDEQNENIDFKIVAGLERLSHVFRILLWDKAKEIGLSPIQIQLLIFIQTHVPPLTTVSYLALEFNVTKPTISDAIKVLEQKKLVKKTKDELDTRSYTIQLTAAGKKLVEHTQHYVQPLTSLIHSAHHADKILLWQQLTSLITQLNRMGIIAVQRTCYNCNHFTYKGKNMHCNLLQQRLTIAEIRLDCPEFTSLQT
ncbi:MAG: MarR family transcriptional regulator [Bacteroidia bacterium]|nr:MarR family transcriptional regulator [Bacteroidia bacterium]